MLVLSRTVEEEIDIIAKSPISGDHIVIKITEIFAINSRIKVKVGIEAPDGYKIYRREITNKLGGEDYIRNIGDSYFDNGGGI